MFRSWMALGLVALFGCNSGASGDVKLGVDVAALTATVASQLANGTTATDSSLVVTRIRVLVAHAKVGYTGGKASGSGPSAEIGPVVVELTADEIASGAHRDFDLGTLPTGTYGGAEIEIQPLDSSSTSTDPALADFVTSKASVLVEGTFGGTAFTFAGHFLAEQGTDGNVNVDATVPLNLALTVDPTGWFVDANGSVIDPTVATDHVAIADGICKSLDTQPQLSGPGGAPGAGTAHHGGPNGNAPAGNGNQAHCVETGQ